MRKRREHGLAEYVRNALAAKNLNYREVARRSGGLISHATVGDVVNNPGRRFSLETLRALAKGLGVPEDELLVVAAGRPLDDPSIEDAFFNALGYDFGRLTEEDKAVYRPILENIRDQINKRAK